MKKNFARLFVPLILLAIVGVVASPPVRAQSPVYVSPTALYRFEVSYWDGGHLLTGFYNEGVANNYTFDPINYPSFDGVGIYLPPGPGYTPAPSAGLVPLHRWTVIQDGWRTHYYYSTYYTQQPPDRYYNGIAGYVFPPGTTEHHFTGTDGNGTIDFIAPLHQLSVFYSQDLGFWNGYGGIGYGYVEPPPDRSGKRAYAYQGVIAALPTSQADPQFPRNPYLATQAFDVLFNPPAPPPPPPPSSCNATQAMRNACAHNGGWWDNDSCSCEY